MSSLSSLSLQHLRPINTWREDLGGFTYEGTETYEYIIDESTGELYFNETPKTIRLKILAASVPGLIPQAIALISGTAYRIIRLLTFQAFWRQEETPRNFSLRFKEWATDLFRVLISPLGIPAFFLTGLYGLIKYHDGRKLYGKCELIFHGHAFLAPCFQAQPGRLLTHESIVLKEFIWQSAVTSLVSPLTTIGMVVYRTLRFLSFYPFWKRERVDSLKDRAVEWLKEGAGVIAAPFAIPLSLLALMFYPICPEKARNAYHLVQNYCLGGFRITLSTDNENTAHRFGGNVNQQDAW